MAEKEKAPSYEASVTGQQHGKPANLQLPPLAGKQQATCGGRNKDSHQQNDSDKPTIESYYLNIAQKGKLMLPTALWVMLIIAGICFLTLLVSLNKSIGTLETIVELEQAKETRAEMNELIYHHHNHHRRADDNNDGTSSTKSADKVDDGADKKKKDVKNDNSNNKDRQHRSKHHEKMLGEMSEGDIRSIELGHGDSDSPMDGSWFELPSWTSLEPRHREQGMFEGGMMLSPPSMPPMALLNDLLDNIVSGPMMGRDNSEPEVSGGSIILTSKPLIDTSSGGPRDDLQAGGFMDSIIKQTLPIFDSIINGNVDEPNPRYTHKGRLPPQPVDDNDEPSTLIISPKIENLNVNFGTVHMDGMPDGDSEEEQPKEEPKKQPTTEEESNSLEKSIENLVLRLIDQKSNPKFGGERQQVDEAVPIVKHHYGTFQNKRPMHSDHSPKSPIADLWSPFNNPFDSLSSSSSGQIFFQTIDGDDDLSQLLSKPQGSLKSHQNRRPLKDQDDATQLVISISGEQDPMSIENRFSKASGETNRHGVSNTRRPSFGHSPYEVPMSPQFVIDDLMDPFAFGQQSKFSNRPHNEHHHVTKAKGDKSSDAEWDMFANGLADSLFQNMLPRPRQPPVSSDEPQVIMIDGNMPFAPGEQRNIFETLMIPENLFSGTDILGPASKKKENKHRPGNKKEPMDNTASLIFGPQLNSFASVVEAVMEAQKLSKNATQKPSVASTGKPSVDNVDVSTEPTTETPSTTMASTEEPARTTSSPQASTSADTNRPTSQLPTDGPVSPDEDKLSRKETEDIITGIMGDILTTPQFGDNQQQSSTVSLLPSKVTPSI